MSEWQPIETAPKDGARVLIYVPYDGDGEVYLATYGYDIGNGVHWQPEYADCEMLADEESAPTHWMPLPAPPKADQ